MRKKIKDTYKIDQSLPLIIFKIDYFSPDTLIPIIGYEIYHPLNKSKLDLTYCKEILIKLNIQVSIDKIYYSNMSQIAAFMQIIVSLLQQKMKLI